MSKKDVHIAAQVRQKRKDFITTKDSAIDAIHAVNSFKIIAGTND